MSEAEMKYVKKSNVAGKIISIRPYQLLCLVCQLGAEDGERQHYKSKSLDSLQKSISLNPNMPLQLVCNVDGLYRYQNPGCADDYGDSGVFNEKRDLDILQKMGMSPGDTRPARDLVERLVAAIKTTCGLCGYAETDKSSTWRGCALAFSGNYERGRKKTGTTLVPVRSTDELARVKNASAESVYQAKTLKLRPHHLLCMACFYSRQEFKPISADNLFEAIDVIQKNPNIPVELIRGCCMICPPCPEFDPDSGLCTGGHGMGLRDQKKDLDVLRCLDMNYGDIVPAGKLYKILFQKICSVKEICQFTDGLATGEAWTGCGTAATGAYEKARANGMGIPLDTLGGSLSARDYLTKMASHENCACREAVFN